MTPPTLFGNQGESPMAIYAGPFHYPSVKGMLARLMEPANKTKGGGQQDMSQGGRPRNPPISPGLRGGMGFKVAMGLD